MVTRCLLPGCAGQVLWVAGASDGVGGGGGFYGGQILWAEGDVDRGGVLLEVGASFGAGDGDDVVAAAEDPG